MISGGNVTIYVSNMDAAVRFYTEALGLKLTNRFGDHWATVQAGPSYWTTEGVLAGLTIGLHPQSPTHPAPGTRGAVGYGLETYEPIERVVEQLGERGVRITSDIIRYEGGNCVAIEAHDANPTYVNEFPPEGTGSPAGIADPVPDMVSGGHAIVYVSSMDNAVRFYTEVLGLKLTNRFGDNFATVEAGRLVIALHPQTPNTPAPPGTKGSMALGLAVDEPIDRVVARLTERGVRITGDSDRSKSNAVVEFEDPDGNDLYLWPEAKPARDKDDAERRLQPARDDQMTRA